MRTNRNNVTENAEFKIDMKKYSDNYDAINWEVTEKPTVIDTPEKDRVMLVTYCHELEKEICALKDKLKIAVEALDKIDKSNDCMKYFNNEIHVIVHETREILAADKISLQKPINLSEDLDEKEITFC